MFGPDNRRATFTAIGERVAHELGGAVAELLPNPSDVGKEYAEIVVGEARFLLMRKDPLGISLGVGYRHVPLLLRAEGVRDEWHCRSFWPLPAHTPDVGTHPCPKSAVARKKSRSRAQLPLHGNFPWLRIPFLWDFPWR
jgi:hypothetical protein